MPNADPAAQRALLDLADVDRAASAARHRRVTLPELAVIESGAATVEEMNGRLVLAQAEVGDLDRAARKLDGEIESVRTRAARDQERLTSGAVGAKEAENLQREVESLARRQTALEDDALELMERREGAESGMAAIQVDLDRILAEIDAASTRRDAQFAEIDAELTDLAAKRAALTPGLPGDVLALYERIHAAGKVAAGPLAGSKCGACGMELDRQSLQDVHTAAPESVQRCPECGAILVRT